MNKQERDAFNQQNIAEFRATGGRIGSFGDAPVLLLTTRGRRSGRPRTSPMMDMADSNQEDRVYVFASAAGADRDPAWFSNLVAAPEDLTVELGAQTFSARAEVLPEAQRAAVYATQAARYPGFEAYQEKTLRLIPVVALALDRESSRNRNAGDPGGTNV